MEKLFHGVKKLSIGKLKIIRLFGDVGQPELGGCTNVKMTNTSEEYNLRFSVSRTKIQKITYFLNSHFFLYN